MTNATIYRFKLSMLWTYAILAGVAFLIFSSCSTHRELQSETKSSKEQRAYQLQEIRKSPDKEPEKWAIYSRQIEGSNFSEYKIVGDIGASPKACIEAFRQDILNQSEDLENKKYPTYEIVSETKDNLLTYAIHNEPFPLKDTEMSIKYLFFNEEDGSTEVTWHEAWDESQVQPSKKLKRVESFRGSWSFTPTSANACKATNSVRFDPKGMPTWLVKPMVVKFLINGLKDIRETASK